MGKSKFVNLDGTIFAVVKPLKMIKIASECFDLCVPAMDYASRIFQVQEPQQQLGAGLDFVSNYL